MRPGDDIVGRLSLPFGRDEDRGRRSTGGSSLSQVVTDEGAQADPAADSTPRPPARARRPAKDAQERPSTPAPRVTATRGPRRMFRLVLGCAAAFLLLAPPVAAAALSAAQAPTYGVVADIVFEGDSSASSETADRELATQRLLLLSRSAIAQAAQEAGRSAKELTKDTSVEVPEGSSILRLQVEDKSAATARAIAESLVTQYTTAVEDRRTARLADQRELIGTQIDGRTKRLTEITARISAVAAQIGVVPSTRTAPAGLVAEQQGLEAEAQLIRQQVADLQTQLVEIDVLNLEGGAGRADVLVSPTVLDEPVAPQPLRAAAGGVLVGLLLVFALLTLVRVRFRRKPPQTQPAVSRS